MKVVKKAVVWILDFIIVFVILVLVCIGLVGLFPFYMLRKVISGKFPEWDVANSILNKKKEEGEESFSPSTDKTM